MPCTALQYVQSGSGVTEESAELVHAGVDILTLPEPVDDGFGGEGVPQIMQARAAPLLLVGLRLPQADPLTDHGEVALSRVCTQPAAARSAKECLRCATEDAVACVAVHLEAFGRAARDWDDAVPAILRVPDPDDGTAGSTPPGSTSASCNASASPMRMPVTAINPNIVEKVMPRSPVQHSRRAASATIWQISLSE